MTPWDEYAEKNPPRVLRQDPQRRRGAMPKPMRGLSDDLPPIMGEVFTKRVSVLNEPTIKGRAVK
jgi:hypothetical protein